MFTTLFVVLIVSTINVYTVINKANDYHETCIAEIQASNFSSAVISSYTSTTDPFTTQIVNRSALNDDTNLERTGRIYEVITTYDIKIPIIGYNITKSIQGFAR